MKLAARITPTTALMVTLCWIVVLAITGSTDALLFLAPALLIVIPLLGGRYLGAELLVRLASRRARSRRRAAPPVAARPGTPATWLPRGTRLIASGLAKRPPPAGLLPQT
jgi:hypothetical protein